MDFQEQTLADNKQLFEELADEAVVKRYIEFSEANGMQLHFSQDQIIHIKARVVDPIFTNMLFSMLHGKSNFTDKKQQLQALGIKVETLAWDGVFILSSSERHILEEASKILERFKNK